MTTARSRKHPPRSRRARPCPCAACALVRWVLPILPNSAQFCQVSHFCCRQSPSHPPLHLSELVRSCWIRLYVEPKRQPHHHCQCRDHKCNRCQARLSSQRQGRRWRQRWRKVQTGCPVHHKGPKLAGFSILRKCECRRVDGWVGEDVSYYPSERPR